MRRGGKSAHKLHTGVVATVVACLVVGIATLGNAERVSDSHGPTARELEDALAASIHITPKTGTSGVGPDTPVVVTSDLGHLTDVSVTSSSGGVVQGTWDDAGNDWKSRGLLLYGHAYRVTATVTGAANLLAQKTATFRTLIPHEHGHGERVADDRPDGRSRAADRLHLQPADTGRSARRVSSVTSSWPASRRSRADGTGSTITSCISARSRCGRRART